MGWSLVHWLAAAPKDLNRARTWTILSAFLGFVLTVALAIESPEAGLLSVGVLAFCALVAYAANARQVGRVEEPLRQGRPNGPDAWTERLEVIVVSVGEPREYEGPTVWVRLLARQAQYGEPAPHWFVLPFALARLRKALGRQDAEGSLRCWFSRLAGALDRELGEQYGVSEAFLCSGPSLVTVLRTAIEGGVRHLVLLPAGLGDDADRVLREQVASSRVTEVGGQVTYLQEPEALGWLDVYQGERLVALSHGQVPPPPQDLDDALVAALSAAIHDATEAKTISL